MKRALVAEQPLIPKYCYPLVNPFIATFHVRFGAPYLNIFYYVKYNILSLLKLYYLMIKTLSRGNWLFDLRKMSSVRQNTCTGILKELPGRGGIHMVKNRSTPRDALHYY